ncbi:hypothetical protein FJ364_02755 [Candidatus Dependentiae bacterium]|nr:hypothetical protein [Candidatus Dependentiae bacterium]
MTIIFSLCKQAIQKAHILLSIVLLASNTLPATIGHIAQGENIQSKQKIILIGLFKPLNDRDAIQQATILTAYSIKNPTAEWIVEHGDFHSFLAPTPAGDYPLREQYFPHYSYHYQDVHTLVQTTAQALIANPTNSRILQSLEPQNRSTPEDIKKRKKVSVVSPLALFLEAIPTELKNQITRIDQTQKYFQLLALCKAIIAHPTKNPEDLIRAMFFDKKFFNKKRNSINKIMGQGWETIDDVNAVIKPVFEEDANSNAQFLQYLDNKTSQLEKALTQLDDNLEIVASLFNISLNDNPENFIASWLKNTRSRCAAPYDGICRKVAMEPVQNEFRIVVDQFKEAFHHKTDLDTLIEILNTSNTIPLIVITSTNRALEIRTMLQLIGYRFDSSAEQEEDKENVFSQTNWTERLLAIFQKSIS